MSEDDLKFTDLPTLYSTYQGEIISGKKELITKNGMEFEVISTSKNEWLNRFIVWIRTKIFGDQTIKEVFYQDVHFDNFWKEIKEERKEIFEYLKHHPEAKVSEISDKINELHERIKKARELLSQKDEQIKTILTTDIDYVDNQMNFLLDWRDISNAFDEINDKSWSEQQKFLKNGINVIRKYSGQIKNNSFKNIIKPEENFAPFLKKFQEIAKKQLEYFSYYQNFIELVNLEEDPISKTLRQDLNTELTKKLLAGNIAFVDSGSLDTLSQLMLKVTDLNGLIMNGKEIFSELGLNIDSLNLFQTEIEERIEKYIFGELVKLDEHNFFTESNLADKDLSQIRKEILKIDLEMQAWREELDKLSDSNVTEKINLERNKEIDIEINKLKEKINIFKEKKEENLEKHLPSKPKIRYEIKLEEQRGRPAFFKQIEDWTSMQVSKIENIRNIHDLEKKLQNLDADSNEKLKELKIVNDKLNDHIQKAEGKIKKLEKMKDIKKFKEVERSIFLKKLEIINNDKNKYDVEYENVLSIYKQEFQKEAVRLIELNSFINNLPEEFKDKKEIWSSNVIVQKNKIDNQMQTITEFKNVYEDWKELTKKQTSLDTFEYDIAKIIELLKNLPAAWESAFRFYIKPEEFFDNWNSQIQKQLIEILSEQPIDLMKLSKSLTNLEKLFAAYSAMKNAFGKTKIPVLDFDLGDYISRRIKEDQSLFLPWLENSREIFMSKDKKLFEKSEEFQKENKSLQSEIMLLNEEIANYSYGAKLFFVSLIDDFKVYQLNDFEMKWIAQLSKNLGSYLISGDKKAFFQNLKKSKIPVKSRFEDPLLLSSEILYKFIKNKKFILEIEGLTANLQGSETRKNEIQEKRKDYDATLAKIEKFKEIGEDIIERKKRLNEARHKKIRVQKQKLIHMSLEKVQSLTSFFNDFGVI